MKSSEIKKAIKVCYHARRPFFLWGQPGVGKSDTLSQSSNELGTELKTDFQLRDVRATLLDPVDLRGLPSITTTKTIKQVSWIAPDFLPTSGSGILFLDELNSAPQSTQAACYQLILDRRLGDYVLPDGWLVCAAGNRETDRAVTNRMPSPLANRLIHFDFDVDNKDWQEWALGAGIMTEVIAFIRFRPELLHQFDPTKNQKAFPTPRSWQFASDLLKQLPPKEIEYEMIKGTVGEGAAVELMSFLQIFRTLPNPDLVLMNPTRAEIPTDPATMYALCGALSRKASEQNMDRLVTYANRIPDEFSVLLVRDALRYAPDAKDTRGYIDWVTKHSHILM